MFESLKEKLKRFRERLASDQPAEEPATPPPAQPPPARPPTAPSSRPDSAAPAAKRTPPADAPPSGRPSAVSPPPATPGRTEPEPPKKVVKKLITPQQPKEQVDQFLTEGLFGRSITESKIDAAIEELELGLMECDIPVEVIDSIKGQVKEELIGRKTRWGADLESLLEEALRASFRKVLSRKVDFDRFVSVAPRPLIMMFVGINGTGKTTAIAKIADRLQKQGYSTVLGAGDTFRAGAIEQLTRHSEKLRTKIVAHKAGSDPAAVAFDAIEHAKARRRDVVLLDTAGRMQTNTNLMDEMKKIKRVAKPAKIVFVGDSLAGNDAIEQARAFDKAVGIDWVILTKVDADAKGGAAIGIAHVIGKPVVFIGVGQEYGDLMPFDVDWMLDRLFGKGKNPPGGASAAMA